MRVIWKLLLHGTAIMAAKTEEDGQMGGKIKIEAELEVITGMHIGGSDEYSPIGAVDKPVVSDPHTGRPIVPGSSLKGKMRTLLSKSMCEAKNPNNDPPEILRLFGASSPEIKRARLQFADAFVLNAEEFKDIGLTEVKFENAIDRATLIANPRQIERVVSGVKFGVCIVYDDPGNDDELKTDMKNTARAMELLQLDYLGGHGTRGSGRVSFKNIRLTSPDGSVEEDKLVALRELFREAEEYELLHI